MRPAWIALLAAAGCGDNIAVTPDAEPVATLEIVGHSDLGARGMNSALTIAGDTIYVGSRTDAQPVLIVDVADPASPTVVGELGAPDQARSAMSARELRAIPDLDLLIVMNLICSPALHGCGTTGAEIENLKLYDISDRRAPVHLSTYRITGPQSAPRSPHEMFVWRDPELPTRVLVFVAAPAEAPGYEIVDVSDPAVPVQVVTWDARVDGGLNDLGSDNLLHSVSSTPDGKTAWFSHQQGGLVAVDQTDVIEGVVPPVLTMLTPPAAALHWPPAGTVGPHSAVPVPGRPFLVVSEEIYPPPFGRGCPWGHLRLVSADVTGPTIVGEFEVAENDPAYCDNPTTKTTFTAHNATVTPNLALVSWYSAGLQVVDISDVTAPVGRVEFRPTPIPTVAEEDPGLGGNPVLIWSYPIIKDGLIYVTDIRNGLYILRYHGPFEAEVTGEDFAEGNSNL